MILLLKAKAAAQGETRTWADGKTRKKIGKKWVVVEGGTKSPERQTADSWRKAQEYFDYSMTTTLGSLVGETLKAHGIESFRELVEVIKTGPQDTAHKLYRDLVDRVNSQPTLASERKAVVGLFGKALIQLKNTYATKPKAKLTIKKTAKTSGKVYATYDEGKHSTELPTMKASKVKADMNKMGGWSVTGDLKTSHVRNMLKTNAATLVSGAPDARKKWILPKKAEDMSLKYTGDSLTISVKQVEQKKERTRATAKVDIKIPYTFAKAFLLNQISSKRTRNNFIFRMEHSSGYRNFMERYGA